jgi:exodeoxyribonuclease VII small subunit
MARAKAGDPQDSSATSTTIELGYEEARAALADVVAALESGDATLEEALRLWERGEEYARICDAWLAGAAERLTSSREAPSE